MNVIFWKLLYERELILLERIWATKYTNSSFHYLIEERHGNNSSSSSNMHSSSEIITKNTMNCVQFSWTLQWYLSIRKYRERKLLPGSWIINKLCNKNPVVPLSPRSILPSLKVSKRKTKAKKIILKMIGIFKHPHLYFLLSKTQIGGKKEGGVKSWMRCFSPFW